jgi:D-alanyl-D-alanine carboxypeptidase/D-alanyl-D-alanine-endopeptidase (penicillin-binding protein 4)
MTEQGFARRFIIALALLLAACTGLSVPALGQNAPPATSTTTTQPDETGQAPQRKLVRPTILSYPTTATPADAQPATTDVAVAAIAPDAVQPSYQTLLTGDQGVLVETLDGKLVASLNAELAYNPASAVKLATALDALYTFGPQHRFVTAVWTNGSFDPQTGTITGDLIISGRDPSFHYEHAVMLAHELNRQGIKTVTGDLIVAPGFTMNFDWSAQRSGDQLYDTLDVTRRPARATRAWNEERAVLHDAAQPAESTPSVAVMGAVYVDSVPANARPLLVHRSSTLVDVLKVLLCYSNNFMAERIGDTLGGPQGLRRFLIDKVGLNPAEVSLSSTSGLGINRVTPRAMMKIYRALREELDKQQLQPSDIMPVAGIDPGTLQKRYTSDASRGSVIGKTGTLGRTDGGASALVGQMRTRSGETLLFVIFNRHGSTWRFRQNQDLLVTQIQYSRGGPAPFAYTPQTLAMRLNNTEVDPAAAGRTDEYESGSN